MLRLNILGDLLSHTKRDLAYDLIINNIPYSYNGNNSFTIIASYEKCKSILTNYPHTINDDGIIVIA